MPTDGAQEPPAGRTEAAGERRVRSGDGTGGRGRGGTERTGGSRGIGGSGGTRGASRDRLLRHLPAGSGGPAEAAGAAGAAGAPAAAPAVPHRGLRGAEGGDGRAAGGAQPRPGGRRGALKSPGTEEQPSGSASRKGPRGLGLRERPGSAGGAQGAVPAAPPSSPARGLGARSVVLRSCLIALNLHFKIKRDGLGLYLPTPAAAPEEEAQPLQHPCVPKARSAFAALESAPARAGAGEAAEAQTLLWSVALAQPLPRASPAGREA